MWEYVVVTVMPLFWLYVGCCWLQLFLNFLCVKKTNLLFWRQRICSHRHLCFLAVSSSVVARVSCSSHSFKKSENFDVEEHVVVATAPRQRFQIIHVSSHYHHRTSPLSTKERAAILTDEFQTKGPSFTVRSDEDHSVDSLKCFQSWAFRCCTPQRFQQHNKRLPIPNKLPTHWSYPCHFRTANLWPLQALRGRRTALILQTFGLNKLWGADGLHSYSKVGHHNLSIVKNIDGQHVK